MNEKMHFVCVRFLRTEHLLADIKGKKTHIASMKQKWGVSRRHKKMDKRSRYEPKLGLFIRVKNIFRACWLENLYPKTEKKKVEWTKRTNRSFQIQNWLSFMMIKIQISKKNYKKRDTSVRLSVCPSSFSPLVFKLTFYYRSFVRQLPLGLHYEG